jgi:hypothetical protein
LGKSVNFRKYVSEPNVTDKTLEMKMELPIKEEPILKEKKEEI